MKKTLNTLLASLGAVLLTLCSIGCYTKDFVADYTQYQGSDIEVFSTNGRYFRITEGWRVDSVGTIRGEGSVSAQGMLFLDKNDRYLWKKIRDLKLEDSSVVVSADAMVAVRADVFDLLTTSIGVAITAVSLIILIGGIEEIDFGPSIWQ